MPIETSSIAGKFEIININEIKFSEDEQRISLNLEAKLGSNNFEYFIVSGKPVLKKNKLYLTEIRSEKITLDYFLDVDLDFISNKVLS